jgi:cellulose synthase (UDP-forming)
MTLFLPSEPTDKEKYSYIIQHPTFLKGLYVLSVLSWCGVLAGYAEFFEYNIWYWLLFGPLVGYITIYHFSSVLINLFYKRFNINAHNIFIKKYWEGRKSLPVIDIILPVCGEDIAILENTWK